MSCGTQDGHQGGLAVWGTGMPGTSVRHPVVNLANRRSRCSAVIATTVDGDRLAHVDRHH